MGPRQHALFDELSFYAFYTSPKQWQPRTAASALLGPLAGYSLRTLCGHRPLYKALDYRDGCQTTLKG